MLYKDSITNLLNDYMHTVNSAEQSALPKNALQGILRSDKIIFKIQYLICLLIGAGMFLALFFFVFQSIQVFIATQDSLRSSPVAFAMAAAIFASLFYMQAVTSYGFLFCRKWVAYITSLHVLFILLAGLFVLPTFGLDHLVASTLKAGIPYYLAATFALLTPVLYSKHSSYTIITTMVYFICLIIVMLLNLNTHIHVIPL